MAKEVRRSEVTENDIFKNARDSALSTIKVAKKLNAEFKQLGATLKGEIATAKFGNTAEIEKFVSATKKAQALQKKSVQLKKTNKAATDQLTNANKKLATLKAAEMKTERELLKETRLLNTEKERGKKATERQTKAIKDENSAYKKLVVSTRKQKNESKELAAQMLKLLSTGKGQTAEFKRLERQFNKVTAAAQRGDKSLKKIDGTVGDNFRNVGNYTKATRGLSNVLGKLGLAFGLGAIVRGTFNTIKDFEQGQADLAAVLASATVPQLEALEAQAKNLGATTTFTAAEVAGLQKEFAKLGFDPSEIQNVTEATLLLAEATGTELARAAEVAGATIRGFGLSTTDTQRVVDVMAASFSKSSLDMEKFSTAMASVAPVANQFGFGIEQTTAILGTLTDRGIDASSAGTGLRNMFLDSNKAGLTFQEALEKINTSTDKTGASFDLFGKRGATLGVILAENQDVTAKLTAELLDADEAAEKMAKTQRETLGGALKLLGSAWDGVILSMNEAGGVGEKLRKGIKFLADNLGTIVSVLTTVAKLFLIYKIRLIAVSLAQKLFDDGTGKMNFSLKTMTKNLKAGSKASTGLGGALKSVGWAGIILLVAGLAKGMWDLVSGTHNARVALEKMKQIEVEQLAIREAFNKAFAAEMKNRSRLLNSELEGIKSRAAEEIKAGGKISKVRKKETELIKKARAEYEKWLNGVSGAGTTKIQALENQISSLESQESRIKSQIELSKRANRATGSQKIELKRVEELIKNKKSEIELRKVGLELLKEEVSTLEIIKIDGGPVGVIDVDGLTAANEKLKETITLMTAIRGLEQAEEADELTQLDKNFKTELEDQERTAQFSGTFELDELTKQINNIEDIKIQQADDEAEHRKEVAKLEISDANLLAIELQKIDLEHQIKLRKIADETQQIRVETIDSLMSKQVEYDQSLDQTDSKLDEFLDNQLAHLKRIGEIAQALTDLFIAATDKRIAKIDEEISAAEKQRSRFEELAKNGNIKASESLAEQNRIIAESNRKKEQEEKRKRTAELINAAVQTYTAKASDPTVKHPLLETIRDITLLTQFIANMPAFLDGTEDTGTNGQGVDGKGGFHAILHPRERVVPKAENALIGGLSNSELARVANEYNTGKAINGSGAALQIGGPWEQTAVIEQLQSLEKTVKENQTAFGVEQTLNDGFQWFTKSTSGNQTSYNRYKVKRP